MKLMRSAFLGLGLLLAVSAAQAQDAKVKADIPFDFVVGDRVMPAGEYISPPSAPMLPAFATASERPTGDAPAIGASMIGIFS